MLEHVRIISSNANLGFLIAYGTGREGIPSIHVYEHAMPCYVCVCMYVYVCMYVSVFVCIACMYVCLFVL